MDMHTLADSWRFLHRKAIPPGYRTPRCATLMGMDGSGSFITLKLGAADADLRLDRVVARHAKLSRNAAARLVARGAVRVNGRAPAKGALVGPGDRIEVPADAGREEPVPRPDLPLEILTEGVGWVAVNKPAGVGVHPLNPGQQGTVLNALAAHRPGVVGVGEGGLRSGVVHRLDVATSGVLLFATGDEAWPQLRHAFAMHMIRKSYVSLVHGAMTGEGQEQKHLAITRHKPAKVAVVGAGHHGARACRLSWRVLEPLGDTTLVEVDLHTGFLHQIRVMLASIGHPLLGDPLYGEDVGAPRTMLHARSVTWAGGAAACEPPQDFQSVLSRLRAGAPSL